MRKPYYNVSRKGWYLKVKNANGNLSAIRLSASKKDAFDIWREQSPDTQTTSLASVIDKFLGWCDRQVERDEIDAVTVANYRWYLLQLVERLPNASAETLKKHEITDWTSNPKWGPAAVRNAISSLKRCLNWAVDEELIAANPIARMKRPASPKRVTTIDDTMHARIVARAGLNGGKIDRRFRIAIIALKHTGGRPQDVARALIENIAADLSTWVLPEHKTRRKTEQPRTVYLSPCLQTVTRIARGKRSAGPLFTGRSGALSVNAITCRMRRLRTELGLPAKTVAYSYRHSWITSALVRGIPIATVAELAGTSVAMIEKHYGHLCKDADYLRRAAGDVFKR